MANYRFYRFYAQIYAQNAENICSNPIIPKFLSCGSLEISNILSFLDFQIS
jgi:hypothetical protein